MLFANKNSFGGTVFTCFSFLWAMNAWGFWSLSQGRVPDHAVSLSVEVILFVIFVGLSWGFGHFARVLFIFLVLASLYESFVTPFTIMLALPLAICGSTVALALTGESLNIFSMIGMIMLLVSAV